LTLSGNEPTDTNDSVMLALGTGGPWELGELAERRFERGRVEEAFTLYEAAIAISDPDALQYGDRARLVVLYVSQGPHCEEARPHAQWLAAHAELEDYPESTEAAQLMMSLCDTTTIGTTL
jgi:hypothetical protein